MERLIGRHAHRIGVKDFLYRRQALAVMGDFFGRRKDRYLLNPQSLTGKALQFFAKDNGVRAAGFHKFDFLRRETIGHIGQFFTAIFIVKFRGLAVNGQHRAGFNRIFLFQHRIAVIIQKRFAVFTDFFDPVFKIHPNATGHADRGQENRGNAVCARHNRGNIDKRHIGAGLRAGP